ncbi:tetratricopeptide repeat protein [Virgibacillus ainsalahensis]
MTKNVELNQEMEASLLSLREEVKNKVMERNYDSAREQVREMEQLLEANDDLHTDTQLLSMAALAKFYKRVSNYDKAASYSQQALNMIKKVNETHTETIIDSHLEYAALEREYSNYAEARKLLATLLNFLESNDIKDAFPYGMTYSSLGKVFLDEDAIENGINQLKQAVDYFREAVSETHQVLTQTIHLLSDAYIRNENYNQALSLYQDVLKNHQGKEDRVQEGKTLLKMGEIYFYIDLKKARRTITKAMKIFEEIYDDNHLDIAQGNLMLGELDENMGAFPRAINYYKRALDQFNAFYEENHFMCVYAYSKIGTLSIKANELMEAKNYLEKGLALSKDFANIRLQFLHALGEIYSNEKRYKEAYSAFAEFLEILEKDGRKKSKGYADTLTMMAFNEQDQERLDHACKFYADALAVYEQLKPVPPEETGLTNMRLAHCYEIKQDKNLVKAESHYEKGYKLIEKTRNHDIQVDALSGIIDFFTRYPNPKKRKKYEDKFVKLQTAK